MQSVGSQQLRVMLKVVISQVVPRLLMSSQNWSFMSLIIIDHQNINYNKSVCT